MRGHIINKSKSGNYYIVLELPHERGDKRKQKWIPVKGNRAARDRELIKILNDYNKGTYREPAKETTGQFLEGWMQSYKKKLRPRSFTRYAGIIKNHLLPSLGTIPLAQLNPYAIQKLYDEKYNSGLNTRSVRYIHQVLHKALQSAVKLGSLQVNPSDATDKPSKQSEYESNVWYTREEIDKFLEAAKKTPYYELFYTALYTGMRRSELLALRWQDIDLEKAEIHVSRTLHQVEDCSYVYHKPKSKMGQRNIPLPPSLSLVLMAYKEKCVLDGQMIGRFLKDSDLAFSHPDGHPMRPNTVTNAWRFICQKAGVKQIRLHDARHSHASILLLEGVHPKIVQERLGHSSISITLDTYSHLSADIQKAAAMRFDQAVSKKVLEKRERF